MPGKIQEWQDAGFPEKEVQEHVRKKTLEWKAAGFPDKEINKYLGRAPFDSEGLEEILLDIADRENVDWRKEKDPGKGLLETISKSMEMLLDPKAFPEKVGASWEEIAARHEPSVLGLGRSYEVGLRGSVSGLQYWDKLPPTFSEEVMEAMPQSERLFMQLGTLTGDLPYLLGGGFLSTMAALPTGPAAPWIGLMGGFGLTEGLRKVYIDKLTKGEISSGKEFVFRLNDALWETYKGLTIGAATGAAGAAFKGFAPSLAAEIPTLVGVSALWEGRFPEPGEFRDAAVLLVGLKSVTRGMGVLRGHWVRTGEHPAKVVERILGENERDGRVLPFLIRREPEIYRSERPRSVEERLAELEPKERPYFSLRDWNRYTKTVQKLKPFSGEPEPYGGPLTPEQRVLQNQQRSVTERDMKVQDIVDEMQRKAQEWKMEDRPWNVRDELDRIVKDESGAIDLEILEAMAKATGKVLKMAAEIAAYGLKVGVKYKGTWEGEKDVHTFTDQVTGGDFSIRGKVTEKGIADKVKELRESFGPVVGDPEGIGEVKPRLVVEPTTGKMATVDIWLDYGELKNDYGAGRFRAGTPQMERLVGLEKELIKRGEMKQGEGLLTRPMKVDPFTPGEAGFLDLRMIGETLEKIGKTSKEFTEWVKREAPYLSQMPFWKGKEIGKELNNLRKELVNLPWWEQKNNPLFRPYFWVKDRASEAGSEMRFRLLEKHDPLFRLRGKDYEEYREIALRSDKEGHEYKSRQEYKGKSGKLISEKAFNAYKIVRKNFDEQWELIVQALRKSGAPEEGVQKLITEIGKIKGYFPRVRKGKYFLHAKKEGEPGVRAQYNNEGELARLKAELEKEGYTITETGEVPVSAAELYSQMDVNAIGALLDVATDKWPQVQRDLLFKEISDVLKSHGFLERAIGRKKEYIKGFEEKNLKRVVRDHTTGIAGMLERIEVARGLREQWFKDLSEKKLDNANKKLISKYIRDGLMPTSSAKVLSAKLRALIFSKVLGLSLRGAIVNLTGQGYAAARLGLDTNMAYVKLTNAMNDYTAHMIGKGLGKGLEKVIGEKLTAEETYKATPLKPEEIEVIWQAFRKGFAQDQYTQEMAQGLNTFGTAGKVTSKILAGPMSVTEKFNRITTFLAAFRVFRYEKGLPREEALMKGKEVVYDAHGLYRDYNLPGAFRGGKFQDHARTAYTFRFFTHNILHLMANMTGEKPVQVAKAMATILLLAGLSGTPFYGSLEAFLARYGINPRSEIKKWAEEHDIEGLADLINWGLGGVLGVDFSGSLGIGLPGEEQVATGDTGEIVLQVAEDLGGVPVSLARDFLAMIEQLGYGDISRAIERSPVTLNVLAGYMAGARMEEEGMTTLRGDIIRDKMGKQVKLTPRAILMKKLGAQPTEVSEQYRSYTAKEWEKARWERKKNDLRVRYKKAATKKDWDEMLAVSREIVILNTEKPLYIAPIDSAALWKEIQEVAPPGGYREFFLEQEFP